MDALRIIRDILQSQQRHLIPPQVRRNAQRFQKFSCFLVVIYVLFHFCLQPPSCEKRRQIHILQQENPHFYSAQVREKEPTVPFQHNSPDSEFLESFVEQHILDFSRFAYSVVHDYDCAQDGVQNAMEAILKYYDNLRDFDEQRLFRYCLAIVKHECLRSAAKRDSTLSIEEVACLDSMPDEMLDRIIQAENTAILKECVARLPEKFQTAILMKYYYNQSDEAISRVIGISAPSVRMILTRARTKLKKTYLELTREEAIK